MTKKIICFIAALVMLSLPAVTLSECTHHDDDGRPYGLVPKGYVAPQPGVPGYTGDQCCAVCGAVIIPGSEIPPLPEPDNREEDNKIDPQPVPVPAAVGAEAPEPPAGTAASPSVQAPDKKPVKQTGAKNTQSKTKAERFSEKYPYRRVRMDPEPGIAAPPAGTLISSFKQTQSE